MPVQVELDEKLHLQPPGGKGAAGPESPDGAASCPRGGHNWQPAAPKRADAGGKLGNVLRIIIFVNEPRLDKPNVATTQSRNEQVLMVIPGFAVAGTISGG